MLSRDTRIVWHCDYCGDEFDLSQPQRSKYRSYERAGTLPKKKFFCAMECRCESLRVCVVDPWELKMNAYWERVKDPEYYQSGRNRGTPLSGLELRSQQPAKPVGEYQQCLDQTVAGRVGRNSSLKF